MAVLKVFGGECLIDEVDRTKLGTYKWHVGRNGYVVSVQYIKGSGRKNQKNKSIYLHRLVMDNPIDKVIDHIDGNKLNNCKKNLRVCTQVENMVNCGLLKNNKSGVKGVAWHKTAKKWEAFIHFNGKKIYLGVFGSQKDAIEKRKDAFNKYYGYIKGGIYV